MEFSGCGLVIHPISGFTLIGRLLGDAIVGLMEKGVFFFKVEDLLMETNSAHDKSLRVNVASRLVPP